MSKGKCGGGSNDFLGGLFDFNGDGRTDPGEMFIAYKIFEATTQDDLDDEDEDDEDLQ